MKVYKLIAVILADGSIDEKRNTVSFVEDPEVVKRLTIEFQQINGLVVQWKTDVQGNSLRARAYSKGLVRLLLKEVSMFRTRPFDVHPISKEIKTGIPQPKIPDICFQSLDIAQQFLKYYASCDGGPEFSIYKRKNGKLQLHMGIKIGCKNQFLRKQLLELLKRIGVEGIEKQNGIVVRSIKSILRFKEKIGFLEESKVRRGRRFKGFHKNDVVKLMILCSLLTKEKKWINKSFASIEELEDFLLRCLKLIEKKEEKELINFLEKTIGVKTNVDSIF
jgi:hypothetical protein